MLKNKTIKILIITVISFCFLFTFSFLTACGGPTSTEEVSPVEETVDEEIEAEEAEEEEEEEEEVVEEEVEEEEEILYEIAFSSNHESPFSIYSCMPDGSDRKKVYDSGFDEYWPCWNSEHTKIVFSSNMDGDDVFDLFTYDIATGEISRLTDREGDDFFTNYGPDKSVVFAGAVGPPEEGNFEIFTVGSPIKQLTDDPAWDALPHYSPDGKTIIFTSDRSGYGKLYTMDIEGNNLVQITNSGEWWDLDGSYSPDGKKIVFASNRSGNNEIWVMPVDNPEAAINLTNNHALDDHPDWSPDGSKIAFISNRDETDEKMYDIFIMDANGENQTNITPDLKGSFQRPPGW